MAMETYKQSKSKADRIEEANQILGEHSPNGRVPVIVERAHNEKYLPEAERTKFIVPTSQYLHQLQTNIRKRLSLGPSQAMILLVAGKHMPTISSTIGEIYNSHKDEDGFLYITYSSEQVFG